MNLNIERKERDNQGDLSRPLRSGSFGVDRLAVVMPWPTPSSRQGKSACSLQCSLASRSYGCLSIVGWQLLKVRRQSLLPWWQPLMRTRSHTLHLPFGSFGPLGEVCLPCFRASHLRRLKPARIRLTPVMDSVRLASGCRALSAIDVLPISKPSPSFLHPKSTFLSWIEVQNACHTPL